MGFGLLNKCILQFSDCFWNLMAITVLRTCNEPRSRFHYIVCLPPPANILILLLSGANAAELENAADSEILSHVMKFLQQIFPQYVVPDPIKYKFTRWSQDPLSFGSYSNFAVHSNQHTMELLARETDDGRLHWAGEHTYVNDDINESANGCVHGAFLTGGRAAAAIRARILLGKSSDTT
ncbi:hypothetical protein I4U23_015815 [Adineta vaga]|nr:hypothetical protein I4U23_015815 [Adineta vaga]